MSNVFEAPQDLFESHNDEEASGLWYLKREDLPEGLLTLIGEGKELEVKIFLQHPQRKDYDSEAPFEAELQVNTLDERFTSAPLVAAKRNVAIAHLWGHKLNRANVRLALRHDWLPSGKTHEEVCGLLVTHLLRGVLFSVPKLTIRWDDHGMVALVNFGHTYISTREHQVKKTD